MIFRGFAGMNSRKHPHLRHFYGKMRKTCTDESKKQDVNVNVCSSIDANARRYIFWLGSARCSQRLGSTLFWFRREVEKECFLYRGFERMSFDNQPGFLWHGAMRIPAFLESITSAWKRAPGNMEVKSEESNEFQTNDTELQLKSLKKILIVRRAWSSYETCFVISFLINHKTGSAFRRCLPD